MIKDPLRDSKYDLLHIMKDHDVPRMKLFIENNMQYYEGITEEQKNSDEWLFDLIHVYKANTFHLGKLYFESMKYCLDKGLITLSPEMQGLYEQAKTNQGEIADCILPPE